MMATPLPKKNFMKRTLFKMIEKYSVYSSLKHQAFQGWVHWVIDPYIEKRKKVFQTRQEQRWSKSIIVCVCQSVHQSVCQHQFFFFKWAHFRFLYISVKTTFHCCCCCCCCCYCCCCYFCCSGCCYLLGSCCLIVLPGYCKSCSTSCKLRIKSGTSY